MPPTYYNKVAKIDVKGDVAMWGTGRYCEEAGEGIDWPNQNWSQQPNLGQSGQEFRAFWNDCFTGEISQASIPSLPLGHKHLDGLLSHGYLPK